MQYGNSVNFFRKTLPNHAKILNSIFKRISATLGRRPQDVTRACYRTGATSYLTDLTHQTANAHYGTPCILNLASFRLFFPLEKILRTGGHNCKEINLFP